MDTVCKIFDCKKSTLNYELVHIISTK